MRHGTPASPTIALRLGDAPDLLGDGIGRVVERHRYERALRPALHDRLQRRDHVAVEGVQHVARRWTGCAVRTSEWSASSRQKAAPSATQDELDRGQDLVEEPLTAPLRFAPVSPFATARARPDGRLQRIGGRTCRPPRDGSPWQGPDRWAAPDVVPVGAPVPSRASPIGAGRCRGSTCRDGDRRRLVRMRVGHRSVPVADARG